MSIIVDKSLFESANAYVVDERLMKSKWYSRDENSMEYKMEIKRINSIILTIDELEFLKSKGNLVIQIGEKVELINFDKERLHHVNKINALLDLPQYKYK